MLDGPLVDHKQARKATNILVTETFYTELLFSLPAIAVSYIATPSKTSRAGLRFTAQLQRYIKGLQTLP